MCSSWNILLGLLSIYSIILLGIGSWPDNGNWFNRIYQNCVMVQAGTALEQTGETLQ